MINEVNIPELLNIKGRIKHTEPIIVFAQENIVFIEEFSRCFVTKLRSFTIDSFFWAAFRFDASRISSICNSSVA